MGGRVEKWKEDGMEEGRGGERACGMERVLLLVLANLEAR